MPRPFLRNLLFAAARVLGGVGFAVLAIWLAVAQPGCRANSPSRQTADAARLQAHVDTLAGQLAPRDWRHTNNLEQCAEYIARHFREAGAAVEFQPFETYEGRYRNVIGRFAPGKRQAVVVGAHYDACETTPGADDNASGVAVLLEVAALLGRSPPDREVELVAYTLEEPPFFRTRWMGSAVHAQSLAKRTQPVAGVIVLEMVGCFRDDIGSQTYPLPLFQLIYPSRGNFIGVVGAWQQGDWVKRIKLAMKGSTDLPVYSIRAPKAVPGVDYSDHLNYWACGINAVMVTDTAFCRNQAYHSPDDTPDKLDYPRMAKVAVAVFEAVRSPATDYR